MADRKPPPKKFDLIHRGAREPTPWGTLTFVGLRVLDVPLQHALLLPAGLGTSLFARFGIASALPHLASTSTAVLQTGVPFIDKLGHPTSALLLLFAAGSSAKQIFWQTYLSKESFPAPAALAVSVYNTVVNSANSLLFLALATTSLRSRPLISVADPSSSSFELPLSTVVGALLYVAGIGLETVAECQRKKFKDSPENAGKVCKVGVWRWARHINYFGYSVWRGGYTMVATGWVGGVVVGLVQLLDLSHRAAGVLDEYCSNRYKEQWTQFKREVPYKIVPGIY
ncbi:hypothetical protein F4804DRAFT_311936 [Jackrogersella minutella]|nr:hypothetical protein F4804DRAFT_311936 [Jackrogersella minutella]